MKVTWFFLCILIFGSCSGRLFYSRAISGADLAEYNSFAILPPADTVEKVLFEAPFFHNRIEERVVREMEFRNYQLNRESPELLVYIHFLYGGQGDPARIDPVTHTYDYFPPTYTVPTVSYYFDGYLGIPAVKTMNVDDLEYTPESVIIDLIDAETNILVWRTWSGRPLHPNTLPDEIDVYVARLFEDLPGSKEDDDETADKRN
jgi:hypothetical protein